MSKPSPNLKIDVVGARQISVALTSSFSPAQMVGASREIGYNCQERTADHIARASVSRHKTADRLGAVYTKYLEFAPGRTRSVGTHGNAIESSDATAYGVSINVLNTEGVARAYHDVTIRPRMAKALTIPVHADAYGRRVADLKAEGRAIFRPKGTRLLVEELPGGKMRPLYALVKSVTLPQDPGLMPSDSDYSEWASDTLDALAELLLAL